MPSQPDRPFTMDTLRPEGDWFHWSTTATLEGALRSMRGLSSEGKVVRVRNLKTGEIWMSCEFCSRIHVLPHDGRCLL